MWKLLSGIALILVLDIVFIWMMTIETDSPEIAQIVGPTAAVPIIHEQPSAAPEAVDDSIEPPDSEIENLREARNFRVSKRHASDRVRRFGSQSASTAVTTPADLFQDTIIWIGRTEVPVKIERETVPVRAELQPVEAVPATVSEELDAEIKKRSFRSKAFGVIKKPYDLIKAFADKLN